ncbi:MAG: response regulator transcription factor [Gammaproteobacteria bacterium]|nr:response regulator transcription factor [Gammaproteobacteria bacterium]
MKILIIDDHSLFRDGILFMLEGLNIDIDSFEAGSFESAQTIIEQHTDINLVLLDLGLPGISHLDALNAIQKELPESMIVVLSGSEDHKMVEQVLRQGARGYIPKSSETTIMKNALKLIISGGIYVPPEIMSKAIPKILLEKRKQTPIDELLTPRQRDVLNQLTEGISNKEIGSNLNLTESTVRVHVAAILKAFNVKNRTQAAKHAMLNQWVYSKS